MKLGYLLKYIATEYQILNVQVGGKHLSDKQVKSISCTEAYIGRNYILMLTVKYTNSLM